MSITPKALFRYLKELVQKEAVVRLLSNCTKPFTPTFIVVPSCGALAGGMTYGNYCIEISSWLLSDAKEAKGAVRHELAHALHDHLGGKGLPHGKEWIRILKIVSPVKWRKDRHWTDNPTIRKANIAIHKGKTLKEIRRGGRKDSFVLEPVRR